MGEVVPFPMQKKLSKKVSAAVLEPIVTICTDEKGNLVVLNHVGEAALEYLEYACLMLEEEEYD